MDINPIITAIGGAAASPVVMKLATLWLKRRAVVADKQLDLEKGEREWLRGRVESLEHRIDELNKRIDEQNVRIAALEHEKVDLVEKLAAKEAELAVTRINCHESGDLLRQYEEQMATCPNCRAVAARNAKSAHAG